MDDPLLHLADRLRERLIRSADGGTEDLHARIRALVDREAALLDAPARDRLVGLVAERSFGLGPLEPLLADPAVRTRVLVLTTFDGDSHVYDAVGAGASGFLLKTVSPGQLAGAVRTVAGGEAILDPAITRRLLAGFAKRPRPGQEVPDDFAALSARELDTARHIAQGLSNAEIASRMYVSEATVKTHVTAVLTKLGVRDRVQVVVRCYESGLVQSGENGPA